MVRDIYCFLDTNIIFSMVVGGEIKTSQESVFIKHKFYPEVKDLKEKMEKNRGTALSSSTVLTEIIRKIDDVVKITINEFKFLCKESWKKIEKDNILFIRIVDEIRNQSYENLTKILSLIHMPSFDNLKSVKQASKILEFLNLYYDRLLLDLVKKKKCPPADRLLILNRDAKIISDMLVIREDLEKEASIEIKIHFVTTDSFLTNFPDNSAFYKKFGFNCHWPTEVLKLI